MRIEDKKIKSLVSLSLRGKGFTLIEIVVAIGLMVIVVLFAGSILKAGIGSYRTAMAQAEIMQKLRVITQQLDSDFRGLRKDAPMFIWFEKGPNGAADPNRFDQIMFFADGDFQSTSNNPVIGNVARIYYGHSQKSLGLPNKDRILARRQHISTADTDLNNWPNPSPANFAGSFITLSNDFYEYDRISLSQWQAIANDPLNNPTNVNQIITVCFGIGNRPAIDLADSNTLHLLMTERVGSFSVQWSYPYTDISTGQTHLYWWPSIDPDGNGDFSDSDFDAMLTDQFGVYFNTANLPIISRWFSPNGGGLDGAKGTYYPAAKPAYPQALKFTFTIYDSRGVFKEGQTFTHIVYLGE